MTRFRYDHDGVLMVLENYQLMHSGTWPDPEIVESDGKRPGVSHHAPYESACLVAGEVAARVKLCGQDGMLVEERYGLAGGKPKKEGEIERDRHIPLYEILRMIKRVTWYCVGNRRGYHKDKIGRYHHMNYETWLEEKQDKRAVR